MIALLIARALAGIAAGGIFVVIPMYPLHVGAYLLTFIGHTGIGVSLLLHQVGYSTSSWIPILFMISAVSTYVGGVRPLPYIISVEMFNFQVRANFRPATHLRLVFNVISALCPSSAHSWTQLDFITRSFFLELSTFLVPVFPCLYRKRGGKRRKKLWENGQEKNMP
ncbi:unnamed protein product [Pieris brassicae]|uniref:Uncharacterized protein n=1 Tax=Pieris brassicae TaxID=7116 RepID=A0A9P0SU94_PIEBR|nr:unnamed protein product [Pieris brassicae]